MRKKKVVASIAALTLVTMMACNLPRTAPSLEENVPQKPIAEISSETPTFIPISSDTSTFTPTTMVLMVSVSMNTNCRAGPGKTYDYLGSLLVGETAEVVARDPTGGYWYIRNPDAPGFCWLWGQYATVTGDTSPLPIFTPPPTPTSPPTPTNTPTATLAMIVKPPVGPVHIFRVTDVTISMDPVNYVGHCPHTITFSGSITTNGAGTVTYHYQGSVFRTNDFNLTFDAAGTKYVTTNYNEISDRPAAITWIELRVTSPNEITSNRISYSVDCTP